MKFSYDWLQSYFKNKLPEPDKLAEVLTMHSFETEHDVDVRLPAKQVLDIDVLPNRAPDCYSHLGIAKEISALLGCQLQIINDKPQVNHKLETKDYVDVNVQESELCPRYIVLLIEGVKVAPSPKWLQERLKSIGQKPINNIVDAANYVMLETGQPLHAFDLEKIGGRNIVVRKANQGEKIITLDDKTIRLSPADLVIADNEEPLAIAGIKGGKKAEISESTKDIVIEAAVFNPAGIRQISRGVNIKTDASFRFEHGISLFLPEEAIERMARLVQETAGGDVAGGFVDVCAAKPKVSEVILKEEDVEKLLGVKISGDKIIKILKSLNFSVSKDNGVYIIVPPKERLDINLKEDVIEEIARIYGYENIKAVIPEEIKSKPERNEEYFYANAVRDVLVGLGFSEVYNYSLAGTGGAELENPISKDKKYLRANLIDGLKQNIDNNFKNFDSVKLFEIGKTFYLKEKEITSVAVAAGYRNDKEDIEAELKGVADALFVKEMSIKGNAFEIDLNLIIDGMKDSGIDLSESVKFESEEIEYKPFSKYPAITRDVSLFVPTGTQVIEVMDVIENTAGELLIDTDLFDEYTPPNGEQRSFAFRLVFQSFEKTLTDKEINAVMQNIINALEENITWQVRKK